METRTEPIKTIAELSGVRAHTLYRNYRQVSGFSQWDQLSHASDYMVFSENVGAWLSIDEVSLSSGELYTYITNKAAKGRKGALVASIKGTRSADIVRAMKLIPVEIRLLVEEVTLDMAKNMASAIQEVFPNAKPVTDRFHVQQLAVEVVQHLRVKERWKEMDAESKAIRKARKAGEKYLPEELGNGDTPKQLLARSRYALYKPEIKWTNNQWLRMYVLFDRYPKLKKAYEHAQKLRFIYELEDREKAEKAFIKWIESSHKLRIKGFESCARTLEEYLDSIVNFFDNRSTNASAESFNAKIKGFRAMQRGVRDTEFFLFRLSKLYA